MAAPSSRAAPVCWRTAQPDRPRRRRTPGSRGAQRGRRWKPWRQRATDGMATKAATPSVPPRPRRAASPVRQVQARVGPGHDPEQDQGGHEHDGVADGGRGREGEDPPGVEQGDGAEPDRIEQELGQEPPEQDRGQLLLLGRARPTRRSGRSASQGAATMPDDGQRCRARRGRGPGARRPARSASSSSPRVNRSTKVGTSTADRAPAASSSNTTVGKVLAASKVSPR